MASAASTQLAITAKPVTRLSTAESNAILLPLRIARYTATSVRGACTVCGTPAGLCTKWDNLRDAGDVQDRRFQGWFPRTQNCWTTKKSHSLLNIREPFWHRLIV